MPVLACALFVSGIAAPCRAVAQVDGASEQVVVHGHAPARGAVKRGGNRASLRGALAVIVPPSYSINLPNAGGWADSPVSWHVHRAFPDALKEMLARYPDLVADVDTDIRLVTITQRTGSFASQPPAPAAARAPALVAQSPSYPAARPVPQPPLLGKFDAGASTMPVAPDPAGAARKPAAVARPATAAPAPVRLPTQPSLSTGEVQLAQPAEPAAAEPAPAASAAVRAWRIGPSDRTVKTALARWASEAGWQFVWDVPTDYAVDASATINGTLEDALDAVVQALKRSQVPIQVILYKGNKVVRVVGEGAA